MLGQPEGCMQQPGVPLCLRMVCEHDMRLVMVMMGHGGGGGIVESKSRRLTRWLVLFADDFLIKSVTRERA